MRRSANDKELDHKTHATVDRCATYLLNKSVYLHYDHCLSQRPHIATGVIEGACQHLVKNWLEITVAKWRLASAEAVLRLWTLHVNLDFDETGLFIRVQFFLSPIFFRHFYQFSP